MSLKEVYCLIPADMLYWSKEQNKFTVFNDEELECIITSCIRAGFVDEEIYEHVMGLTESRIDMLLLDRMVKGEVVMHMDGEKVVYSPVNHDR